MRCRIADRDRYLRLLGTCVAGSVELNRWMVEAGWAVAFEVHGGPPLFAAEEEQARRAKRGIWQGPFERPRQWRDQHRSLSALD